MTERLTPAEVQAALAKPRRPKYGNRRTCIDGQWFDSAKEARRYQQLRLLERAGQIEDLECHPPFQLVIGIARVGRFTPDFSYTEGGRQIVEEVKGGQATKTEAYRLRAKVFRALYPNIELREV